MQIKNETKYYIETALWHIALMMINGSIMQTCLLELGTNSNYVSLFVSIMQVVQVVAMLLFSPRVDKFKNIIFSYAITHIMQLVIIFAFLFVFFFNDIDLNVKLYIVMAAGLICSAVLGLNNTLAYKVPYSIFNMEKYGTITGVSGTLCGFFGVAFSSTLSFFLKKYKYFSVMKVFYIIAAVLILFTVIIIINFKNNGYTSTKTMSKKTSLFKYKPFLILFIPNLLRGFNSGVVLLMVTIGYHIKTINSVSAGYLIIVTNVAMIISCLFYSYLAKLKKDRWVVLISSGIIAISMPLMCINRSPSIFLIMYFLVYFVFNLITYATPVLVTKVVDYNIMGQYSAWRMLLHTVGSALGGVVCIPMIDALGAFASLALVGSMQLISGVVYFVFCRKQQIIF